MLVNYKVLAENIKLFRKGKMTQAELGRKINRSESSIRKYESGLIEIPNSVIESIATALGVDSIDLYFDHSKQDDYDKKLREVMGLPINTIDTHFNSDKYTKEELDFLNKMGALGQKLNNTGQDKAIEQVELLTKIPEYRKDNE